LKREAHSIIVFGDTFLSTSCILGA